MASRSKDLALQRIMLPSTISQNRYQPERRKPVDPQGAEENTEHTGCNPGLLLATFGGNGQKFLSDHRVATTTRRQARNGARIAKLCLPALERAREVLALSQVPGYPPI